MNNNLTPSSLVFKTVLKSSIMVFPEENGFDTTSRGTFVMKSSHYANQKLEIKKSYMAKAPPLKPIYEEKEKDLKDPIFIPMRPSVDNKEDPITVHILSVLSQKPLSFIVERRKAIFLLKTKIEKGTNVPPHLQHLIYNLRSLKPQKTFEYYKIDNNDTMSLVIQERAGGCFAFTSNSYLRLENSQTKIIKDLKHGDMVKTERGFSKVINITVMKNEEFAVIQTEKRTIKCTPNQAFFVPGKRFKAVWPYNSLATGYLAKGDFLFNENNENEKIKEIIIHKTQYPIEVFNLEVEGNPLLFVDGVLVHNRQIFIKVSNDQLLALDFDESLSIQTLKQSISKKVNIPLDCMELKHGARLLLDRYRLSDENIQREAMIRVSIRPKDNKWQFGIRLPSGKCLGLDVAQDCTVESLLNVVQQAEKIPIEKQILIYRPTGQTLQLGKRLSDYQINNRSYLHLEIKSSNNNSGLIIDYQNPQGKVFSIYMDSQVTIKQLKEAIGSQSGCSPDLYFLIYDDQELSEDSTISEYGFQPYTLLFLVQKGNDQFYQPNKISINMRLPWGKTIHLKTSAYALLEGIRLLIIQMENLYHYQKLEFWRDGKLLNTKSAVISNGIQNGDTIDLKISDDAPPYCLDLIFKNDVYKIRFNQNSRVQELRDLISTLTFMAPKLINFVYKDSILYQDNWLLGDCFPMGSLILAVPSHEGGSSIALAQGINEIPFKGIEFLKKSLYFVPEPDQNSIQVFIKEFPLILSSRRPIFETFGLRDEEIGALALWSTNFIYKHINRDLISDQELSRWKYFLKCLCSGLRKLPYHRGVFYRGFKDCSIDKNQYFPGAIVQWKTISAMTKSLSVTEKFSNERGAIFEVEAATCRDISKISLFPKEEEVLLEPFATLLVEKVEEKPGNPIYIRLKEFNVPRSLKVVFWVDDQPQQYYQYAHEMEFTGVSVLFCTSTKEALSLISLYRWLLYFPNAAFKVVTDMTRFEDGKENPFAGTDLIEGLCMKFKFSFDIFCFCGDVEKALKNCEDRKLKGNFKISNKVSELKQYLVFE